MSNTSLYVFLKIFRIHCTPSFFSTMKNSPDAPFSVGFQGNELFIGGWLHCHLAHYWVFTHCSLHFTRSQAAKGFCFLLIIGWMMLFFLLVNKQNGNRGWWIHLNFPNMYKCFEATLIAKKHFWRRSFSLFVCGCVLVDPLFFKMRPWKSTWSSSKIQTTKMRNHTWAFQYFMRGESEQFVEPSPFHSPPPGHMHLDGQGFWYLPVQLHRWIDDGKWCSTWLVGEDFDKMYGWFSSVHSWH